MSQGRKNYPFAKYIGCWNLPGRADDAGHVVVCDELIHNVSPVGNVYINRDPKYYNEFFGEVDAGQWVESTWNPPKQSPGAALSEHARKMRRDILASQNPSITQLIERAVKPINTDTPSEDVYNALNLVGAIVQAAAALKERVYEECRPWFEAHGDIQAGDMRWRLATEKTYECLGKGLVIETLLEAAQGDFERVCECLSANPFKVGQIKAVLNGAGMKDRYNDLFREGVRRDVKTDEPLKKIVCENTRFVVIPRK